MGGADRLSPRGLWFLTLARPVFRAVDFYSTYVAGWRFREGRRRPGPVVLAALDARRRRAHASLAALSASHGEACAACRGGCCTDERFRDSIVDRLLADPGTPNVAPRSLRSARRETHALYPPLRRGLPTTPGYCPNCSATGCTIEPTSRPVQCLAYQCRASVKMLSEEEIACGARAVAELMSVMVATARAPLG